MKKTILCIFISLASATAFSQQERITSVELNGRGQCFEVNQKHQLLKDTVFHVSAGFRINPGYDIIRVGNEDYVKFTYPDFRGGKQYVYDRNTRMHHDLTDPLYMTLLEEGPVHSELVQRVNDSIVARNGKTLAMKKSDFDLLDKTTYYSVSFRKWKNYSFSSGIITIPFKLRPKVDTTEFNVTTDVTLGGYFGLTKRISAYKRYYITIPATAGLSYINITNNNTSDTRNSNDTEGVVPGITWSTGIILQMEDFNIGIVLGQDFASSVGCRWIYNGKLWYSFAIGYNFLKQK